MRNVYWAKQATSVFGGVNRRKRIGDGEWGDAENLSTREYPTATVREKRVIRSLRVTAGSTELPSATNEGQALDLTQSDGLVYLSTYDLLLGGAVLVGDDTLQTAGKPEKIVPFGRGAFTTDGTFIPYAESSGTPTPIYTRAKIKGTCSIGVSDASGNTVAVETTKPGTPTDGQYWYDASKPGLYRWSGATEEWVPVPETWLKLTWTSGNVTESVALDSLFDGSRRNDCVTVRLARPKSIADLMKWIMIKVIFTMNRTSLESSYIVENAEPVTEEVDGQTVTTGYAMILRGAFVPMFNALDVEVERKLPVFDYICSSRNRVWGCRYGENSDGDSVNEIYASALGDQLNWFKYEGTAADSYTASVGKGGAWTGIAAVEDDVFFFKEDRIFWLSGTQPSDFRLREIEGPGIAPGQAKSVIVKDGTIYYKATRGFMRISGYSYPVGISTQIDEVSTGPLVGVADRNLLRWVGEDGVYVLDLQTGAWMTESRILTKKGTIDTEAEEPVTWETVAPAPFGAVQIGGYPVLFVRTPMVSEGTEVETLEAVCFGEQEISTAGFPNCYGSSHGISFSWVESTENAVEWQAVTGLRGLADVELKRLRSLQIRVVTEGECSVKAWIEYDLDGTWIPIANEKRKKKGTFLLRHENSRQCDFYRLKFEGVGDVTIYDIAEELEYGGEFAR